MDKRKKTEKAADKTAAERAENAPEVSKQSALPQLVAIVSLCIALYFGYQTLDSADPSAVSTQTTQTAKPVVKASQDWLKDPVINPEYIKKYNKEKEGRLTLAGNSQFQHWKLEDAQKILTSDWTSNHNNMDPCTSLLDTKAMQIPERLLPHTEHCTAPLPIRSQGNCGSSYAITVADMYSARYCKKFITKGIQYATYSPQQLLSCYSREQCSSGNIDDMWNKIHDHGIVTDQCFPYSSQSGTAPDCNQKCTTGNVPQSAQPPCFSMSEQGIKREVKQNGPVIIVIPVYSDFLVYKTGIYKPDKSAKRLDGKQAVLIVGWASEHGEAYWIIKNSWGEDWGNQKGNAQISIRWLEEQGVDIALGGEPMLVEEADLIGDTTGRSIESSEYDELNFDLD